MSTGVTGTELLADLGEGWTSTPDDAYLVDVAGHQFSCGGEVRFYGAWSLGEAEVINSIISDHPEFVDPAGVGPGMLVDDAIALRGGSATVGIAIESEQREFINFADGGTPDWQYQVLGPGSSYAGVYPESDESYIETTTFTPGATVVRVWLR